MNFLPNILAYVSNKKIPGQFVETEAPRIAQTPSPNFIASVFVRYEWVCSWDSINPIRMIYIKPEQTAQQSAGILSAAERIIGVFDMDSMPPARITS